MTDKEELRKVYISRINKVMNFVENNLDKELPLSYISEIAYFSPFHFHRIFSAITGETLNAFIKRKRVEKIASLLLNGDSTPLTELGFKYGFNSGVSFSRAFKNFYGISPSEFKEKGKEQYSKICKVESKNGKEVISFEKYICSINNILKWINMNAKIEAKEMPELRLAYVKHLGEFNQIGKAYEKLMKWAGPKGLLSSPEMKTVTVYHDDPKVTEMSKVRQSACITIDTPVKFSGEVGEMIIKKGKYAVGRFEISVTEFEMAWDSMCVWVAENGYTNRDGEYYELYHNDHREHPEQKFILDICVPVE